MSPGGREISRFGFLSRLRHQGRVTVCDMTEAMLTEGAARAARQGYEAIDWVCGDAMALPFPDRTFDAYTIAFGIRNVTRDRGRPCRSLPGPEARRALPVPGILAGPGAAPAQAL